MFDHEMTESSSGVFDIPYIDPDSFQNFQIFMYTGQFSHVISSNALCQKAADKYTVEELKEECYRRMVSDLSVETVLDVIPLAVTYEEDEILKIASEFFLENAEEIVSTENWELFHEKNIPIAN